jgi:epoxyqueuosine reductase QueG
MKGKQLKVLNEIKEILFNNGASLVGFANIKNYDLKIDKKFKSGISIAVALDPQIIKDITEGPTLAYYDEYKKVNKKLDFLSDMISSLINDRGYNAENWGATDDRIYGYHMTELPHKTMATLSGLGWIGKCALLITKEFGAAIRLTTVLTDID